MIILFCQFVETKISSLNSTTSNTPNERKEDIVKGRYSQFTEREKQISSFNEKEKREIEERIAKKKRQDQEVKHPFFFFLFLLKYKKKKSLIRIEKEFYKRLKRIAKENQKN